MLARLGPAFTRQAMGAWVGHAAGLLRPVYDELQQLVRSSGYQAESDLVALVQPHYRRAAQEGRTLIQSAWAGTANVAETDKEFRIRLHPLSSPHRTRAIAA